MLSLENLHSITDAPVRQDAADRFLQLLQRAASTQPVFFPDAPAVATPWSSSKKMSMWLDRLSVVLVTCAIARAEDRQFHRTVRRDAADAQIADTLGREEKRDVAWELYRDAFLRVAAGTGGGATHPFSAYLPDAARWGREYTAHVTTPAFLNVVAAMIAKGEPYLELLDLILAKLRLLFQPAAWMVVDPWKTAFPNAGITADRKPEYLNLVRLAPDMYVPQVRAAIGRYRTEKVRSVQPGQGGAGGSMRTVTEEYRYYGESVIEFLKTGPSLLHLTTGQGPDNRLKV
jgi:hypothetical protein